MFLAAMMIVGCGAEPAAPIRSEIAPRTAAPDDLSAYRWKHRLVILEYTLESDPRLVLMESQLAANAAGLAERDMLVLHRQGASSFAVVLVGKDGGEKRRSNDVVAVEELFAQIDAMPMRQSERRRAGEAP
jgi:hypothetical protein